MARDKAPLRSVLSTEYAYTTKRGMRVLTVTLACGHTTLANETPAPRRRACWSCRGRAVYAVATCAPPRAGKEDDRG